MMWIWTLFRLVICHTIFRANLKYHRKFHLANQQAYGFTLSLHVGEWHRGVLHHAFGLLVHVSQHLFRVKRHFRRKSETGALHALGRQTNILLLFVWMYSIQSFLYLHFNTCVRAFVFALPRVPQLCDSRLTLQPQKSLNRAHPWRLASLETESISLSCRHNQRCQVS